MQSYREKLWPAPWIFISTALVIPASVIVFAPIQPVAGYVVAAILYGGTIMVLLALSPVIEVKEGELWAGRAHIEVGLVGEATAYSGAAAFAQRGPVLDARAYLMIRGWIGGVVRVPIEDSTDPTPYWLLSSRRPEMVVAVIAEYRRGR